MVLAVVPRPKEIYLLVSEHKDAIYRAHKLLRRIRCCLRRTEPQERREYKQEDGAEQHRSFRITRNGRSQRSFGWLGDR
jgi:hypothetical protein